MTTGTRRVLSLVVLFVMLGGTILMATQASAASMPIGTALKNTKVDSSCPSGSTCTGFDVSCPGPPSSPTFFLSVSAATSPTRGTVVFVSDKIGTQWWSVENPEAASLLTSLRASGLQVVQVRWSAAWTTAPKGSTLGPAVLACRPVTAIRTAYSRYHAPLGLTPSPGACGFCVAGNGMGASAVGYALSHYGQDSVIDQAVMMGGPTHATLVKSCGSAPSQLAYQLSTGLRDAIDKSYGKLDGTGPCATSDPNFIPAWTADAIATGGNDYEHPDTGIAFLLGILDPKSVAIAGDYADALSDAGTVAQTVTIPDGKARIAQTQSGRTALQAALPPGDSIGTSPSPSPSPTASPSPSTSPTAGPSPSPSPTPSSSPSPGADPIWPYVAPPVNPGLPLGEVEPVGTPGGCPVGASCRAYTTDCPGLPVPGKFVTGVSPATGTPKAMLVLFSGGAGGQWWSEINAYTKVTLPQLQDMGFTVVQVKWVGGAFALNGQYGDYGPAKLLCRPSTAVRFIHDYLYEPLDIHPSAPGMCGFCMSGNSGGANQMGYMLTHYGLDGIIDAQIPSGGPPYSSLRKSCLRNPGESAYAITVDDAQVLDLYYGFPIGSGGPCVTHDPAFTARWNADAVSTGGNDYTYPGTTLHFILGEHDTRERAIVRDWYERAVAEGSPMVTWQVVPGGGHTLWADQRGIDAWMVVLTSLLPA